MKHKEKRIELLKCLQRLNTEAIDRGIDITEIDLTDPQQFSIIDTDYFSIYVMTINCMGDTICTTDTIDYVIDVPCEIDDFWILADYVNEFISKRDTEL